MFAQKRKEKLEQAFATFVIFILSFPKFKALYGEGLDWSYKWALNNLFAYDYPLLTKIVYPIGPLGVLKMPLAIGDNFIIALICFCCIKLLFIYLCLEVVTNIGHKKGILAYLLVLISAYFIHVDFMFMGCTFILSLLAYIRRKYHFYFIIPAFIFSAIGYFIKTSIGISSLGIVIATLFVIYYEERNIKKIIIDLFLLVMVYHVLGTVAFLGLLDFYSYMIGSFYYAKDYSQALTIYPLNNWWALFIYLLSVASLFFIKKDKATKVILFLLLFPWFTSWKHAMSRQDVSHYFVLISYVLVFAPIVVLYSSKNVKSLAFIFTLSISCLIINSKQLPKHRPQNLNPFGINNFLEVVFDQKEFIAANKQESLEDLNKDNLDHEIINALGKSTVDVIPWELSYIPANNLNWQPRPLLQMGAFSSWFDEQTAQSFTRELGPEKILYHLERDKYKGDFGSFDDRLLLNDHPITFKTILNNYNCQQKFDDYIIFKKNKEDNFVYTNITKSKQTTWNTWVEVPEASNDLLRVKVNSSTNLLGKLMAFIYKPEAYFVDYKLDNDRVKSYRYVAANAQDGLWLNPWMSNSYSSKKEPQVIAFRLRTTDERMVNETVNYCFEQSKTNAKIEHGVYALFQKYYKPMDTLLFSETSTYDEQINKELLLESNSFSKAYSFDLTSYWDSIPEDVSELDLEINVDYMNINSKALLVISLDKSEVDFWEAKELEPSPKLISQTFIYKLTRSKHTKGTLKVYVWNNGAGDVKIDNFKLEVQGH